MVVSNWLQAGASQLARWRRTQVSRGASAPDRGQEILRRRLDGDDPFWWILAGGTHVPGFDAYTGK